MRILYIFFILYFISEAAHSARTKEKPFYFYTKIYSRVNSTKWLCLFCGHETRGETSMKHHTATHSNDKQFICATCGHGCRQKSTVLFHIKRKHSKKT